MITRLFSKAVLQKAWPGVQLLLSNCLVQGLSVASLLVISLFSSASEIATFRLLQSYAGLLVVAAALGSNAAVLKACSDPSAPLHRITAFSFGLRRTLMGALFVIIGFELILPNIRSWSSEFRTLMSVFAFTVPLSACAGLAIVYMQATKNFRGLSLGQSIAKTVLFTSQVVCTFYWGNTGFVFGTIAANALGSSVLLWMVRREKLSWTGRQRLPRGVRQIANYAFLGAVVSYLYQSADLLVLDQLSTNRGELGVYALAGLLAQGAGLVTTTVQAIVAPYFSQHEKDLRWIGESARALKRAMLALSCIVGVLGVIASVGVKLLLGPEFQSLIAYTIALMVRHVVWAQVSMTAGIFDGLGETRANFVVILASAPLMIGIMVGAVYFFGTQGAAVAQIIGSVIAWIATEYVARRVFWKRKDL